MPQLLFNKESLLEEGAIILIDKPLGWTSNDVVAKVRILLRNYYGIPKIKVGHAGTLDPLATGLMVLCVGKRTREAMTLTGEDKEYEALFRLGATTPSYDMETEVDATFPTEHITDECIDKAINALRGTIMQKPPIFSAKRVNGKRAYKLARKGVEDDLPPVEITVHKFEVLERNGNELRAQIACSKGTYIRALARDLGQLLGSGAHLAELRRTRSGNYEIRDAVTLETLEKFLDITAEKNLTSPI
jgi:tRNA pseudouridine synthase B